MKELSEQKKLFVKYYTDSNNEVTVGNARQSAIAAGYSEKSAHKRGSLLLKEPEIQRMIKGVSDVQESALTTGDPSIKNLFEGNIVNTLQAIMSDKPEKFADLYLKFKKAEEEQEEEFSGLSIAELVQRGNQIIKETQENIERVEDSIREGTLQE